MTGHALAMTFIAAVICAGLGNTLTLLANPRGALDVAFIVAQLLTVIVLAALFLGQTVT